MVTQIDVDAWDPAYGTGFDPAGGESGAGDGDGSAPAGRSSARVEAAVEVAASSWQPLVPPAHVRAPDTVLLVDGVRRIDAGVWITGDDGGTHRGLAASYAAGVVRCDLRAGAAAVASVHVRRGLFTSSPAVTGLAAGGVGYAPFRVTRDDHPVLIGGIQAQLAALEAGAATEARQGGDDLLVVDGPLRGRAHLPQALGYVKTHRVEYLPPELSTVVTRLGAGQRSPVFLLGTSWHRFTWYLRLPGTGGAPWAGVVRVECAAELPLAEAVALADLSAVTLPRFASTAYKDPRAPQNLVPVAGLERRLRAMLGDARLLHRTLVLATRRTPVPA